MRKIFIIISFIAVVQFAKAQVGLGYLHSDVQSTIRVSTNLEKRLWGEFRLGLDVQSLDGQLQLNYNFKRGQYFNMYAGLGAGDRFESFTLMPAFGFIVKPIKDLPQFGINAEASAGLSDLDTYTMGSIGIRWMFKKKDK